MTDVPPTPSNIVPGPGFRGQSGPPGPPRDPGIEARISVLEADTREIKGILQRLEPLLTRVDDRVGKLDERTRKIETDFAELRGRVSQLPSTIQLIGFVLAVLALAGLSKYLGH